jgi:flagellar biosynthesis/type III secretory pathway protein FliH
MKPYNKELSINSLKAIEQDLMAEYLKGHAKGYVRGKKEGYLEGVNEAIKTHNSVEEFKDSLSTDDSLQEKDKG